MPALFRFGVSLGYPFLGGAHGLVGSVDTANPAAWAALAFVHLVTHHHNVLGPGFWLGTGDCPADPFIARQR